MCFALPLRVISTSQKQATMEDGRKVNLSMVRSVKKGDWLLVQSNLAVDKLTQKEARAMRLAIKEVSDEVKFP
jgi:hydrogenase assembly chaperone HypC/HupF